MRKTLNISVSEDMHRYIVEQSGYGTVSEYIRSLVRREQQRRADYEKRPLAPMRKANDAFVAAEAFALIDRLKAVIQGHDERYCLREAILQFR